MTKAAEKREKQLRERLTSLLTRTLVNFQDKYLGAYTNWSIAQVKMDLANEKAKHGTPYPKGRHGVRPGAIQDRSHHIQRLEDQLGRTHTMSLEFLIEAKVGYDRKFSTLIEKLVKYQMDTRFLQVEKVINSGAELSFLITNDDMEVHARAIFVNGDIKAPHYRFITTKRNK